MEESISGGRKVRNVRPTINSYMYGNAKAIAAIATMDGNTAATRVTAPVGPASAGRRNHL